MIEAILLVIVLVALNYASSRRTVIVRKNPERGTEIHRNSDKVWVHVTDKVKWEKYLKEQHDRVVGDLENENRS